MLVKSLTTNIIRTLCFVLLITSVGTFAADPKHENETTVFDKTFSWQLMGGISGVYQQKLLKGNEQSEFGDYLNFSLLLDLYYKGFFIQSNHRRSDAVTLGGEIGYELIVEDSWELDIISKTYVPGYEPKEIIKNNNHDIPTLAGLKERNIGEGLGLRYSHFYDGAILSVDVATLTPLSHADGWIVDVFYSHLIPYRNWDIYLGAGLTHYSSKVTDYFFGIDQAEVSEARSFYKPYSSNKVQLELFARHPISNSWSFSGGITQSYYSAQIKNSPLIGKQHLTQVMLGVLYVF
jgi:outer membrane scaffolding protein for murein synthesis (MipA/OmpV family)